jgi:hypothetical protein
MHALSCAGDLNRNENEMSSFSKKKKKKLLDFQPIAVVVLVAKESFAHGAHEFLEPLQWVVRDQEADKIAVNLDLERSALSSIAGVVVVVVVEKAHSPLSLF